MRVVTLEEHFNVPELLKSARISADHLEGMPSHLREELAEVGEHRLARMAAGHVNVQVISATAPGAEVLTGEEGIRFARATNDKLFAAVQKHRQAFAGFAHLPLREPKAAALEFERAVVELGFRGALINGTTDGKFLDDPLFGPILTMAEKLDLPIYIHPAPPPEAVRKAYYSELPGHRGEMLSMAGFGWHSEVAVHVLRMVLAGTFERHPQLKVIIGHMGEMLPFMLERADQVFRGFPGSKDSISVKEVILKHVWITTSGFFTAPPFLNALQTFGADRIMFSIDYPFATPSEKTWQFLNSLAVSPADLEKIASGNADRLLKL